MQGYAKKTLLIGLTTLCSFAASANNFNYNTFEIRMGASPSTFGGEFTTLFTQNPHIIGRVDTGFESDWDEACGNGFNNKPQQHPTCISILLHTTMSLAQNFCSKL